MHMKVMWSNYQTLVSILKKSSYHCKHYQEQQTSFDNLDTSAFQIWPVPGWKTWNTLKWAWNGQVPFLVSDISNSILTSIQLSSPLPFFLHLHLQFTVTVSPHTDAVFLLMLIVNPRPRRRSGPLIAQPKGRSLGAFSRPGIYQHQPKDLNSTSSLRSYRLVVTNRLGISGKCQNQKLFSK